VKVSVGNQSGGSRGRVEVVLLRFDQAVHPVLIAKIITASREVRIDLSDFKQLIRGDEKVERYEYTGGLLGLPDNLTNSLQEHLQSPSGVPSKTLEPPSSPPLETLQSPSGDPLEKTGREGEGE